MPNIAIHFGEIMLLGGQIALGTGCCCECVGDDDCTCCCCNIDEIEFLIGGIANQDCNECESMNTVVTLQGGTQGCSGSKHGPTVCFEEVFEAQFQMSYTLLCLGADMTMEVVLGFDASQISFLDTITNWDKPGDCVEALNGNLSVNVITDDGDECNVSGVSIFMTAKMEVTPNCVPP